LLKSAVRYSEAIHIDAGDDRDAATTGALSAHAVGPMGSRIEATVIGWRVR
jgi:hypothetical protein